jgi:nitric oxide reductase NorE protein
MWVFVLGDMVIFGVYFVIFMIERTRERSLFLASQRHINATVGVVNTLVLLTSSWFVARAVLALRMNDRRRATRFTYAGASCGVAFMVIKAFEWHSEVSRGYTFGRNDYFMFYFALTGVHLLHVLIGLIVLAVVVRELRKPDDECRTEIVEAGATFWHMVDLLWIVVFALVYVMR